ncbi:MAG: acetate kinase [Cyanobium sp.]
MFCERAGACMAEEQEQTKRDLVLAINAGSSSIKLSVLNREQQHLWQGQCNWNASPGDLPEPIASWLGEQLGPWASQVERVVHRLVHGGVDYRQATQLTPAVIGDLARLIPLAPLHNGAALALITWMQNWLESSEARTPQWACFDTAFHHTLPAEACTYAIPGSWRAAGLQRFGFHGLNHQHVAEVVRVPRLISCHLGAGCSLCAIRDGRSIATTMGFTPMEGLVMATRSGSLDPGLLLHQLRAGFTADQLDQALNHQSGLLGLSGLSGDMRILRSEAAAGHPGAALAIAVFRHQLLQGIGAMAASLGGVDAIALTGGIGEHDGALLDELEQALSWLPGAELIQVAADEEGQMARACLAATPSPPAQPSGQA